MAVSLAGAIVVGVSESGGGRTSIIGVVLWRGRGRLLRGGVVIPEAGPRHASADPGDYVRLLTGTVACLPFAGQLVSPARFGPVSDTLTAETPERNILWH